MVAFPDRIEAALQRTPGLVLGPFYPVALARRRAGPVSPVLRPSGTDRRLDVAGRVLDTAGRGRAGVRIEVWHADAQGRYRHPAQPGVEAVAPDFVGYQQLKSDADGCWVLKTVVPGPYDNGGVPRAPHLHFHLTHRGTRLVTQMFLPGHPLNAADRWYRAVSQPALLVATLTDAAPDRLVLAWDIVLPRSATD